jgi:hypothetical protein
MTSQPHAPAGRLAQTFVLNMTNVFMVLILTTHTMLAVYTGLNAPRD